MHKRIVNNSQFASYQQYLKAVNYHYHHNYRHNHTAKPNP